MKRYFRSFSYIFLFFFLSVFTAFAELRPIHISQFDPDQYQQGTFFSLIFQRDDPSIIWIAPSEGAKWANGTDVKDVVRHYGGHADLRQAVDRMLNPEAISVIRYYGAGFSVDKKGHFKFSYRSRSINGSNNDGLLPAKYQDLLTEEIRKRYPTKFPPPRKSIGAYCQSFFSSLGFASP